MIHRKKSKAWLQASQGATQAQTNWVWGVIALIVIGSVVLFAPFTAIVFLYGATALGIVLLVLVTVALTIFCIWLGSRMNDKSQENFIAMIGHLKGALTISVREDTRTWGMYERAQIELEKKQAQEHLKQQPSPPTAAQMQREDWASQFMDVGIEPIAGEWQAVDDEDDYVMEDIV